jgi:hypothetical protein
MMSSDQIITNAVAAAIAVGTVLVLFEVCGRALSGQPATLP